MMGPNEHIWGLSKWRFLQCEASVWTLGNKVLELAFFAGLSIWIYFEFFSGGVYTYIKIIGLIIAVLAFSVIRSRFGLYEGFFDGYEKGFEDAATKNCDYWGDTHDEHSDNIDIATVISQIRQNEEKMSEENKKNREDEVRKGLSKLVGYILTWRKIR